MTEKLHFTPTKSIDGIFLTAMDTSIDSERKFDQTCGRLFELVFQIQSSFRQCQDVTITVTHIYNRLISFGSQAAHILIIICSMMKTT
jgi:hypothetical protein